MGTSEIAVYPRADGMLRELESEMKDGPHAAAKILEAAELNLILGHSDRAMSEAGRAVAGPRTNHGSGGSFRTPLPFAR